MQALSPWLIRRSSASLRKGALPCSHRIAVLFDQYILITCFCQENYNRTRPRQSYFLPSRRMREVKARPSKALKVRNWGEAMSLLTT
jgi:hypothetical protein